MKISARVNTYNEEDNIAACLETLTWADEIVVVDSFSTDRTVEIARRYTDRVYQNKFVGYREQHDFGDSLCENDWVMVLDADERLTPEAREEILAIRVAGTPHSGFRIPRRTWYLDRWIRHSGWYPDHQLRLFRKSCGGWAGPPEHAACRVTGSVASLRGDILHFTRRSLKEHLEVLNRYTDIAAHDRSEKGRRGSFSSLLTKPPVAFLRSYVWRAGFLDGWAGLVIAYLAATYVAVREAKLLEIARGTAPTPPR